MSGPILNCPWTAKEPFSDLELWTGKLLKILWTDRAKRHLFHLMTRYFKKHTILSKLGESWNTTTVALDASSCINIRWPPLKEGCLASYKTLPDRYAGEFLWYCLFSIKEETCLYSGYLVMYTFLLTWT